MLVDVHTHLTHKAFAADLEQVIDHAQETGLGAIIVNGLTPESNRQTLEMSEAYDIVYPALGIYPIEAVHHLAPSLPFELSSFDIDAELDFIEAQAKAGKIIALGECGLDGYWVDESTFSAQEKVFERFIEISLSTELPLIIHTRKRELRAIEMLAHYGAAKVNFHCYGGRIKPALKAAEQYGWSFSIPPIARKNQGFAKLLSQLPPECILTETDAPYLAPDKAERNQPANVALTVAYLAELRGWSQQEAIELVWQNFHRLFEVSDKTGL